MRPGDKVVIYLYVEDFVRRGASLDSAIKLTAYAFNLGTDRIETTWRAERDHRFSQQLEELKNR